VKISAHVATCGDAFMHAREALHDHPRTNSVAAIGHSILGDEEWHPELGIFGNGSGDGLGMRFSIREFSSAIALRNFNRDKQSAGANCDFVKRSSDVKAVVNIQAEEINLAYHLRNFSDHGIQRELEVSGGEQLERGTIKATGVEVREQAIGAGI